MPCPAVTEKSAENNLVLLVGGGGFWLVFPFSIESVVSLIPFNAAPIPLDIAMQAVPRVESGISLVDNAVGGSLPAATPISFWACSARRFICPPDCPRKNAGISYCMNGRILNGVTIS